MSSTQISIHSAKNSDQPVWDNYVRRHPAAVPYHLFAWKLSVEKAYKHKGYYLIAEENGGIRGILPLIHMKLPFFQNQLVSLPFCDLAGPLADNSPVETALKQEAIRLGQNLGCQKIEIRTREKETYPVSSSPLEEEESNVLDRQTEDCQLISTPYIVNKVSMLLSLPSSSEELWNGFKSKLRSQVRKAEKNGLIFKWGEPGDIKAFYNVFSKNMHELGSPVHGKKFIAAVHANYGKNCRMGLVCKDHIPVGCGILLLCDRTVSIPWASTLREYNRLSPNMLLYWNFLLFAADNGFTLFDFGRSTPQEGTYKFKTQWGAGPAPLQWDVMRLTGEPASPPADNSDRRKKAIELWRKLPLSLANYLGPQLRRYISL